MPPTSANLTSLLTKVAEEYPAAMVPGQVADVARIQFHIEYIQHAFHPRPTGNIVLGDLGGGIGLFSVGCAAAGFKQVVLVDDFQDQINHQQGVNEVYEDGHAKFVTWGQRMNTVPDTYWDGGKGY